MAAAVAAQDPNEATGDATLGISALPSDAGDDGSVDVLFRITPPTPGARAPTDIVCVVDVSGSMGGEATTGNPDAEQTGLSLLDITKHAVRTVVASLNENDRFALVAYSSQASLPLPMTDMTAAGKQEAEAKIAQLTPGGQTNLWDGLHTGLEQLLQSDASRNCAVMLLTDGLPNIVPPRGHIPMLKLWMDEHPLNCSINTFGFGYNLDSALLRDLAVEGQGMFAFIPDSGFVGTAFVNTSSNILATCGRQGTLTIANDGDSSWGTHLQEAGIQPCTGHPATYASWGLQLPVGTIQAGQTNDFLVRLPPGSTPPPSLFATFTFTPVGSTDPVSINATGPGAIGGPSASEVPAQRARLLFVEAALEAMEQMRLNNDADAQAIIANVGARIRADAEAMVDEKVVKLLEDIDGQVTEAVSRRDWFNKWGKHYIPSLVQAHRVQQCNNFKDPGIQVYGGDLFTALRDAADALFMKLPPPTPSRNVYARSAGSYGSAGVTMSAAPSRPVDMSMYNNMSNPCFHGESLVSMADGSTKAVHDLRKGDLVATVHGTSKVQCVVKTLCAESKQQLVELPGGLRVTPYHPVKGPKGNWCFPADLAPVSIKPCEAVYNFVMNKFHTMTIDGTECATLGHGMEGPVIGHAYFASMDLVEKDLEKLSGWSAGFIVMNPGCMVRDPNTGLACGFNPDKEYQVEAKLGPMEVISLAQQLS